MMADTDESAGAVRSWAALRSKAITTPEAEARIKRFKREAPQVYHLWTRCPDCGRDGAHHSYTDRSGESVGVRCG